MLCLPLRVLLALRGALHIMVCQVLTTLLLAPQRGALKISAYRDSHPSMQVCKYASMQVCKYTNKTNKQTKQTNQQTAQMGAQMSAHVSAQLSA